MELWKIHKYCESAELDTLIRKEAELAEKLAEGRFSDTNAIKALDILREYIELKRLFQ